MHKSTLVQLLEEAIARGEMCSAPDTHPPRNNTPLSSTTRRLNFVWRRTTAKVERAVTAAQARSECVDEPVRDWLRGRVRAWERALGTGSYGPTPLGFFLLFVDRRVAGTLVQATRAELSHKYPDNPIDFTFRALGELLQTWLTVCIVSCMVDLAQDVRATLMSPDCYRKMMKCLVGFTIPHDDAENATWSERRDLSPRALQFQRLLVDVNRPLLVGNCRRMLLSLDDDLFRYVYERNEASPLQYLTSEVLRAGRRGWTRI